MPKKTQRNPHSFTKQDLEEILQLFKDDKNSATLFNFFYPIKNSDENVKVEFENTRQAIIAAAEQGLKDIKRRKSIEILTLYNSLEDLKTSSTKIADNKQIDKKNVRIAKRKLRATVVVADKLFKIVPFHDDKSRSNEMLNVDSDFKNTVAAFTANNALAKIYLSKGKYEPTAFEKKMLELNKGKSNFTLSELNPQQIEQDLSASYNKLKETPFVQMADKTNYLKRSGLHRKSFMNSGGILLAGLTIITAVLFASAPLEGADLQASFQYFLNQWAAMSLIAGSGIAPVAGQFARNRIFKKKREKIANVNNKEKLFELARQNDNYKDFEKAVAKWNEQHPDDKIEIDLGRMKRTNYSYIRAAAKKEPTYGTRIISRTRHKFLAGKKYVTPIVKREEGLNLSLTYSKDNPLSTIFGLEGVKNTSSETIVRNEIANRRETQVTGLVATKTETKEKTTKTENAGEKVETKSGPTPLDPTAKVVVLGKINNFLEDIKASKDTFYLKNIEFETGKAHIEIKLVKNKVKSFFKLFGKSKSKIEQLKDVALEQISEKVDSLTNDLEVIDHNTTFPPKDLADGTKAKFTVKKNK